MVRVQDQAGLLPHQLRAETSERSSKFLAFWSDPQLMLNFRSTSWWTQNWWSDSDLCTKNAIDECFIWLIQSPHPNLCQTFWLACHEEVELTLNFHLIVPYEMPFPPLLPNFFLPGYVIKWSASAPTWHIKENRCKTMIIALFESEFNPFPLPGRGLVLDEIPNSAHIPLKMACHNYYLSDWTLGLLEEPLHFEFHPSQKESFWL